MLKKLCQHLQDYHISTRQVRIDMSLNEFFEKILDGNMTKKEAEGMISIND